ncbi:MAG: TAT-variant-translocated molybdopterin oxidoreductase [Verrucomicrobia bacterium]|nr:TAT-variant-translocated molybdopterin oxidoreductase [Verrucomicrobiota bacterium]
MKPVPPACAESDSSPACWRSLDHLAGSPAFRRQTGCEFPGGLAACGDAVSRRHFLRIMSASFLMAGVGWGGAGCRRPEERIFPWAHQPPGVAHGMPQYYATAMPTRGSALPLLVKTLEGRPVKIEGHPGHPDSLGATDPWAQASLLSLYDPDRARRFAHRGRTATRAQAFEFLDRTAAKLVANGGDGLCLLMEQSSSPSRERLQSLIAQKFPKAHWFVHEPVRLDASASAARQLTGQPVQPRWQLDRARILVALDCDFLGGEADPQRAIRDFARGRAIAGPGGAMNRLYAVEALMTLTGMNADHRLRVPAGAVMAVGAALAAAVAADHPAVKALARSVPLPPGVDPRWVRECAADLKSHRGASVVLAGHRQPAAVHALAHLLNQALGNIGATVHFMPGPPEARGLAELAARLQAGQVDTLLILGPNPACTAPVDLEWSAAQAKTQSAVIRLGYFEDETFAGSTWHLPMTHYLEAWGDGRTRDGTWVPIQPVVSPLFGGLTDLEVLARVAGLEVCRPHAIVRDTFKGLVGPDRFEDHWAAFLHDGFRARTAASPVAVALDPERVATLLRAATPLPMPGPDSLEVVFHRDYKLDDGRWNNNGWLQELPDPVTKLTWDAAVLMSRNTAQALGVRTLAQTEADHGLADMVEVTLGRRTLRGPAWVQPGMADFCLGLALGYGREQTGHGGTGRVGHQIGAYNAYALRTAAAPHIAQGARLRKLGTRYRVACTQEHGAIEGRPIVREATASHYAQHPQFAQSPESDPHAARLPRDAQGRPARLARHPYDAAAPPAPAGDGLPPGRLKSETHQWGMVIDLNACVGCSACVLACQSENNIPIVGKDQVWRNREMHWLRLDRYYTGAGEPSDGAWIDNPRILLQPMLCQHCESAPCEYVCPVNATVHDDEGLNLMVYNRCIGTRYCSNNCPYKVRRFNFFDYNRRPLHQLRGPFYPSPLTTATDGQWTLRRWLHNPDVGTRPEDEWELLKLARNPDVTVRMRGVMEKCTFCIQRLQQAKIVQKVRAGASANVRVPEGAVQTACQQACPAGAIVFGNLLDPDSPVARLKRSGRNYTLLDPLDLRPRVTYLARVRNPNPRMPEADPGPPAAATKGGA